VTRHRPAVIWLVLVLPALAAPAAAEPQQQMTFRNNLLPGHLTVHRISRTTYRTAHRAKHVEKLKYRQKATWVQCNVDQRTPGKIMVCQMMVDRPAKVISLRRGKKKIKPPPPASDFILPKRSTRLRSSYKSPQDGPVQVPLTDPAERAVLHALLDFAHWPKGRIPAGHRWERDIRGNGITGTQTFEFVDLAKEKHLAATRTGARHQDSVVARVTLYVEGKFEDPLARDYVFGKGQAIFYWSRPDRVLIRMEAQADYRRKRENAPERFKLTLDVSLTDLDSLDEERQERTADQLIAFDKALKAHRGGDDRLTRERCRRFRTTWPDSIWMPAVDELESRTVKKKTETKRLSMQQLNDRLVRTILTHEAARTNFEYDLLERSQLALEQLAETHHAKLKKLAKSDDDARRGRALFALAFSGRPGDFSTVQKAAQDESPKVRASVLAALTARRSPDTSVDLLIIMLDDEKANVRRRACQAVAACVSPEHYSTVKAVEKLTRLMIHDERDAVRLEAVRALAAIGAPADVPKLEKALTHELNTTIREEIHKAIETLKARSD
jgi:hypothetical protein